MDKYEIRPGTLAGIRNCQGDSQSCLGFWSLCQVCSSVWKCIGSVKTRLKAKDDNCAGVWIYATLLIVLLKTIKL